jgi:Thiamine pyrophosphate-requiring enzymes [acetolactate synthase, pyruvate dehydrogenase (cytochrome), glyoxylate carboligase, phosphonopyruvate decarboxylase]
VSRTAASLLREALENVGVRYTFGIPGVHNTEIYDELAKSKSITPVLVTHEGGGAFMADAVSRSGASLGTLVIVPAAGVTHAASGIAEAFLDGIPMLVISGGIRRDTGRQYQLHDVDQHAMLRPITKGTWLVDRHADVIPTIHEAVRVATSGEPGPVFVEIPVNLQLLTGDPGPSTSPRYHGPTSPDIRCTTASIYAAAEQLTQAKAPTIFIGWGAIDATAEVVALAERLGAPVSTSLQGTSAFPANHPLHAGFCLGRAAVPAVEKSFEGTDCMLAVGTRFGEIATGSYGWDPPANLIHVDVNPAVFNANYPASVTLEGDAKLVLQKLLAALGTNPLPAVAARRAAVEATIASQKAAYIEEWLKHDSKGRVNPARFFQALRRQLADDATVVLDDGNHTFLAAELMPIHRPRGMISPTDFNCMGYCVPATIGAKLARPEAQVVGIVGDGAFRMTAMELATAIPLGIGVVVFVFNDGELAQIAQAQELPYNRKTCTVLGPLDVGGVAQATGAKFFRIDSDADIEGVVRDALAVAQSGKPALVDVKIDYSKRTRFTEGIVKTNLERFDFSTKARLVGRALWRRISG